MNLPLLIVTVCLLVEVDRIMQIKGFTDHDQIGRIGGKNWDEGREHWRRLVESRFPGPVVPEPDHAEPGERLAEQP